MKGPSVDQIVRGVVPIYGEFGRYHVKSRSSHKAHLVDINENGFYGQCDCEAFTYNYGPKLRSGIPTDTSLQCYHIKQAKRHFCETMQRRLWDELHKEQPKPRVEQETTGRVMPPPRRQYQLDPRTTYKKS